MLKIFLIRLFAFSLFSAGVYWMLMLAIANPGRDSDTGMADSGIYGWIGAFCILGAIGSWIVPSKEFMVGDKTNDK